MKVRVNAVFEVLDEQLVREKALEKYTAIWGEPGYELDLKECVNELAMHSNDGTYGFNDVGLEMIDDNPREIGDE